MEETVLTPEPSRPFCFCYQEVQAVNSTDVQVREEDDLFPHDFILVSLGFRRWYRWRYRIEGGRIRWHFWTAP
jgi:hypothetical protein